MTIRAKLIITDVIVFGVILIAVAVAVYNRTREAEIARMDSRLDTYAAGFITEFEDQWENNEFPDVAEIEALTVPPLPGIRVLLTDRTGRAVYRRGDLPHPPDNLIRQSLSGAILRRSLSLDHEPYRESIHPVESDDSIRFVLALAAPTEDIENRLDALTVLLIVTLSFALALSALAILFFTGRAFRPITRMVEAAEQISAATLDHRIAVPAARDEVSRLAEALNAMMTRIEDAFRSQRRFVADASHELRTPLTVIYGELEYLRRQLDDGRSDQSITTVLHEIDRLAHLVDQLLVLARFDASKSVTDSVPVRLDEVLAEVVQLLQQAAAVKNLDVHVQIDDVIEIAGSPDHLKRAVLNVLDNAIKYSPEHGEVSVALQRDNDEAVIAIRDNGPGIDPGEVKQVFQRFFRSPRVRQTNEGSGLGLAITRELIEAHGGTVRIAAPDSAGTTVEIRLPLRLADNSSARA